MRIAVSSNGASLESEIDERFGRCPYFLIIELDSGKPTLIEAVKNEASERSGGAGSFAARIVAEKGVEVVISGELGPNAKEVLDQFKIRHIKSSGKIIDALNNFDKK